MLELLRTITMRATGKAGVTKPNTAEKPWLAPPVLHGNTPSGLVDIFDERELKKWFQSVIDAVGRDDVGFVCEPKCDGIGVVLTYEEGVFVEGRTLDNDAVVTQRLRAIKGIPSRLFRKDVPGKLQVLGEVYVSRSMSASARGTEDRRLEVGEADSLDIFVYGIGYADGGSVPNNQRAALAYLKNLGFRTNPDNGLARSPDDVIQYYQALLERRNDLDYECDGMVVKVNRLDYQQRLGYEEHGPHWAAAYMFNRPQTSTRPGGPYLSREDASPMNKETSGGEESPGHSEQPLSGLRFVVKASTDEFPRPRIESMVEELGGLVSSSVNTTTDYVVIAESSGARFTTAQQSGIRLVSQNEFLQYYRSIRLSSKVQKLIDRLDRL